jgi:hypothetical protein
MKKLIQHQETEYDFALTFRSSPAPVINDEVESGVTDDDGQTIHFAGSAFVVATEEEWSRDRKTTVYVRQFRPIYLSEQRKVSHRRLRRLAPPVWSESNRIENISNFPLAKHVKHGIGRCMSNTAPQTKAGLVDKVADIVVEAAEFAATENTVKAVTDAGKTLFAEMFGHGALSVQMPKSRVDDFVRFVGQKGLLVI